ncbi:hypothetical protein GP486_006558 [Trichoglossum hirsutum]|uniref:Mid2 domain-containing protein n=1 Tax=Trichoglossum hirsutum TaxID=265104 RepID=A0A9P8L7C1_9PEZI|nr:hypothetical protein GP486_006558 [Trichoglossum hirsutum]
MDRMSSGANSLRKTDRPPTLGVGITDCGDGSFCCDLNNSTCCQNGQGVFLDGNGQVKLQSSPSPPPSSLTSSTTTAATPLSKTTSHPTTLITVISPSPTSRSSSGGRVGLSGITNSSITTGSLDTAQTIGIGIGIPLGVMIVGALGVMLYFQQKRLRILEEATRRASTTMGGWSETVEQNESNEKNEKILGWLSAMLVMENASSRASACQPPLPELPIRSPQLQPPVELPG